jgi:hypothetical protein
MEVGQGDPETSLGKTSGFSAILASLRVRRSILLGSVISAQMDTSWIVEKSAN